MYELFSFGGCSLLPLSALEESLPREQYVKIGFCRYLFLPTEDVWLHAMQVKGEREACVLTGGWNGWCWGTHHEDVFALASES